MRAAPTFHPPPTHFSANISIYHRPWWRPDVSCHRFNGAPLELSVPASVQRVVLFDRSITKLLHKGCAVRDACPLSLSSTLIPSGHWRCFRGKIPSNLSVSFLSPFNHLLPLESNYFEGTRNVQRKDRSLNERFISNLSGRPFVDRSTVKPRI